jgi:uncharacterized protein YsxB (DUF464 family)
MIRADLVLEGGFLKSCRISGHANAGPKGADIVCAAVTVLARTAHKTLSQRKGITVLCDFPERGEFFLEVTGKTAENNEFLAGTGTFLKEGLLSIAKEFPGNCVVNIKER